MGNGDTRGRSLEITFHFKEVPVELKPPEVRVQQTSYVITETTDFLQIRAKCRKATKYAWSFESLG